MAKNRLPKVKDWLKLRKISNLWYEFNKARKYNQLDEALSKLEQLYEQDKDRSISLSPSLFRWAQLNAVAARD